eukprot:COSAG06_NODE_690_length_13054_cov_5.226476_12_plen_490_part_00
MTTTSHRARARKCSDLNPTNDCKGQNDSGSGLTARDAQKARDERGPTRAAAAERAATQCAQLWERSAASAAAACAPSLQLSLWPQHNPDPNRHDMSVEASAETSQAGNGAMAPDAASIRPVPVVVQAQPQPPPPGTQCDGPCCCTWCGGAIIQVAAFGFLSFSTMVAWAIGMGFAYLYAIGMLGLAKYLERRIARDPSSVDASIAGNGRSMLYIASMVFVFIAGMYIPINVINGDGSTFGGSSSSSGAQDLTLALPDGASAELQAWAAADISSCISDEQAPGWATFSSKLYVSAVAPSPATDNCGTYRPLLRFSAADTSQQPEQPVVGTTSSKLYDAYSFLEFNNALYFSATTDETGRELFAAATDGTISVAAELRAGTDYGDPKALLVDGGFLYFKARPSAATESNYGYWNGAWQLSAAGELTELVAVPEAAVAAPEAEPEGGEDGVLTTVMPSTDETPEVQGSKSQLWGMYASKLAHVHTCTHAHIL